jgi:hypothetical protein
MTADQGDTIEAGELAITANSSDSYDANVALFVLPRKVSMIYRL